jgi:hypothetical protein
MVPVKSGSLWHAVVLIAVTFTGILAYLPLVPCPSCRGTVFQERMRLARAPGITPSHAVAIQAFAEADMCRRCERGRLTTFRFLLESTGGCW